ncbi:LysR family transcriptional regulator [Rhodobacteraceae bacterium RKSG542]|nr:LysR family transcriptional regulator [Pseudovibrio flavus]
MRSIDLELMPYFLAVARGGSLRSGAGLLNANYGTVNRNVQALEASYGVPLFNRSSRGFTLTEAGEALLPYALEIEEKAESARKRVIGLDKSEAGLVRFSLPPILAYTIMPPILARFHLAYPQIEVEMRITSTVEDINRDTTDVSLRGAMEITENVIARRLFAMAIGLYASKTYLEGVLATAEPSGEGVTTLGWPEPSKESRFLLERPFPHARQSFMVGDGFMRLQLVREGLGIAYLPVVFSKVFPDLKPVPNAKQFLGHSLWLVLHSDMRKTVRIRRFVDFMAAELMALKKDMQGDFYGAATED